MGGACRFQAPPMQQPGGSTAKYKPFSILSNIRPFYFDYVHAILLFTGDLLFSFLSSSNHRGSFFVDAWAEHFRAVAANSNCASARPGHRQALHGRRGGAPPPSRRCRPKAFLALGAASPPPPRITRSATAGQRRRISRRGVVEAWGKRRRARTLARARRAEQARAEAAVVAPARVAKLFCAAHAGLQAGVGHGERWESQSAQEVHQESSVRDQVVNKHVARGRGGGGQSRHATLSSSSSSSIFSHYFASTTAATFLKGEGGSGG